MRLLTRKRPQSEDSTLPVYAFPIDSADHLPVGCKTSGNRLLPRAEVEALGFLFTEEGRADYDRAYVLQERHLAQPNWPVIDGVPVRPYALPEPSEQETEALMAAAKRSADYQATLRRTAAQRALTGFTRKISARKGKGFEVTLLRKVTLEFHRKPTEGGEAFRLELYRFGRWGFDIEFWRSR